jgi:uncharacterized OB-fold protein
MATARQVPIMEGLFANTAQGPRLLGSKCVACRTPYFPKSPLCHNPDCTDGRTEDAAFGPRGTLWSCAIQDYPPPAPTKYDEPYAPYAMAVVDLVDGLRVVGRVSTDDPRSVQVGMDVELVIEPLHHDENGNEVVTWKFKPV